MKALAKSAFAGSQVKSVTIPDSVRLIEEEAFYDTPLKTITFKGDGLVEIKKNAFALTKLESLSLPSTVSQIGDGAFQNAKLKQLDLGKVQIIGNAAFAENHDLSEVAIPDTLAYYGLGEGAFRGCTSLKKVTIAADIILSKEAFMDCNLTSADFGDRIHSYNISCLSGNKNLTSVTISKAATSIGDEAFAGCESLSQVTGGDMLQNVSPSAFEGTKWLASLPDGPAFVGHVLYLYKGTAPAKVEIPMGTITIGEKAFMGQKSITEVSFPISLYNICPFAFADCDNLKAVTIPANVSYIGEYALGFYQGDLRQRIPGFTITGVKLTEAEYYASYYGLAFNAMDPDPYIYTLAVDGGVEIVKYTGSEKKLTLPSELAGMPVTSIGNDAFIGMGITDVVIPATVRRIGENAFMGTSLTSVTIPDSVVSIGQQAFAHCGYLEEVTFGKGLEKLGMEAFCDCALKTVVLPEKLTQVDEYVFQDCTKLKKATFTGATPVGKGMFSKTALEEIPAGPITKIQERAFEKCVNIKNAVIPDTVTEIGSEAFLDCTSLKTLSGGMGLVSVTLDAFGNTPWKNALKDGEIYVGSVFVTYKGTVPTGTSLAVKAGTLAIEPAACKDQLGITSLTLPEGLRIIGASAFEGCTGIKAVTVPESIKEIGDYALGFDKGWANTKVAGFTITGTIGTVAETYAKANGFTFNGKEPSKPARDPYQPKVDDAGAGYKVTGIENPIQVVPGQDYAVEVTGSSALSKYAEADLVEGDVLWTFSYWMMPGSEEKHDEPADLGACPVTRTLHFSSPVPLAADTMLPIDLYFTKCTWDGMKWTRTETLASAKVVLTLLASPTPPTPETKNPSIKLDVTKKTLYTAGSSKYTKVTLTPTLTDLTGTVKFKSDNTAVATVSSKGVVKAVAKGSAKITAKVKFEGTTYKATCKVTVKAASLKISQTSISLVVGKKGTIVATATPKATVKWSVDNSKIATVSSKGVIKAKKKGTTYVYAEANGFKKKIKVKVTNK